MQGSYHDPDWSEQVTIPVRRVGDRWEIFSVGQWSKNLKRNDK